MSTIAVGDIHGDVRALDDLLAQVMPELAAGDTLVFLGDYIDVGVGSRECVDRILVAGEQAPCPVVALLGNHEDWMLRSLDDPSRHSWILGMEAFATISSYSERAARILRTEIERAGPRLITERIRLPYEVFFDAMPEAHIDFFRGLKLFHRTPDVLCTHGGLDPAVEDIGEQSREALIWGTDDFPSSYRGADTIVYGHWGNVDVDESGWPSPHVENSTFGIDTRCHGVLTAMRFPEGDVMQSQR